MAWAHRTQELQLPWAEEQAAWEGQGGRGQPNTLGVRQKTRAKGREGVQAPHETLPSTDWAQGAAERRTLSPSIGRLMEAQGGRHDSLTAGQGGPHRQRRGQVFLLKLPWATEQGETGGQEGPAPGVDGAGWRPSQVGYGTAGLCDCCDGDRAGPRLPPSHPVSGLGSPTYPVVLFSCGHPPPSPSTRWARRPGRPLHPGWAGVWAGPAGGGWN